MRRGVLLLASLLLLAPTSARALGGRVEAGAAWVVPAGDDLASGPGARARAALGLTPTLHVGIEVARSRHRYLETRRVDLQLATLTGSWTFDAAPLVPVVTASVGGLWLEGVEAATAIYGLGVGLEWWPVRPLSGPNLAAEVRYTGLVEGQVLPVLTWVGVRAGWAF